MKRKIAAIFVFFGILFCTGVGTAYYNTRSYGFEQDANVIARDDEKITILDFNIYYEDIDEVLEKAKKIMPQKHYTCAVLHHNVV